MNGLWLPHTLAALPREDHRFAAGSRPELRSVLPEVNLHPGAAGSDGLEPHPLDYDWRFTSECSEQLADALVGMGRPVVLLGTPSLTALLRARNVPVALLDRNPAHSTGSDAKQCDFRGMEAQFTAPRGNVVLLDAPWYPEELGAWLRFATSKVEGAELLAFSLWPADTRPSAGAERDELLGKLKTIGRVEVRPDALLYDVPLFEHVACAERGVVIDAPWRRGDLVVVRLKAGTGIFQSEARRYIEAPIWRRFTFGRRQLAVRLRSDSAPARLLPLDETVGSWRFNTVSRRDPRRPAIDIWTSHNVVARATSPTAIAAALDAGMRKRRSLLSSEHRAVLSSLRKIGSLDGVEQLEGWSWQHRE
jgi:hypothetical protein